MSHDFGLGADFSEASTPGGRAVRRAEEPSETFGCPANWTAERCFLRRCYRNPTLTEALTLARATDDEQRRARVLASLAPNLGRGLLADALTLARSIKDEGHRARLLGALAPHLTGSERSQALTEAVGSARSIRNGRELTSTLSSLAPHLDRGLLTE